MSKRTSKENREEFQLCHQRGETYQAIAEREGFSLECVRYWCRCQQDGGDCHTRYHRMVGRNLSHYSPMVRYYILRDHHNA